MRNRMLAVVAAALLAVGCGADGDDAGGSASPSPMPGIANPASVNCAEKGGREETRTDPEGGEYGVCIFADGSECESWAFFRGECKPGQ